MACVSECDLPSGVERGTGADTVSLLTLKRELAPPTECGTYATRSLGLWDVCAGMHTCEVRKGNLYVFVFCTYFDSGTFDGFCPVLACVNKDITL